MCKFNLPRSVCLFWEALGSAEHRQDRRTITLRARRLHWPGKASLGHKWPVVSFSSFYSFTPNFHLIMGTKCVGWVRFWKMPIFWCSLLFISCPGWSWRQARTSTDRDSTRCCQGDMSTGGVCMTIFRMELKHCQIKGPKHKYSKKLFSSSFDQLFGDHLPGLSSPSAACHQKLPFTTFKFNFQQKPQSLWQTFKNAPDGLHK